MMTTCRSALNKGVKVNSDPGSGVRAALFGVIALATMVSARADETELPTRQSLDDAWWTGPIVTPGAGTLPQGHALIEPYLFDVIRYARFDDESDRRDADRTHSYGSLTYMLYGVTDRFTVGMIPTFGYNDAGPGLDSSGVQFGDFTLQGQYRLSQFSESRRVPTASVVIQQSFPTGKYDELGDDPGDGFGTGAYTTTVGVYSQYYFWMPNGRILRTRFNLTYSMSGDADVSDVSVYGTSEGFRGNASPGDVFSVNSSLEYSVTSNWVFAMDLIYQHDDSTRVSGQEPDPATGSPERVDEASGTAWRLGVAPAIEYNWNSRVGLIIGARWFFAGRNTNATITPAIALNMVY